MTKKSLEFRRIPKRVAGRVVPQPIWILSSLLIGCSLALGGPMLIVANKEQPIAGSRFAHHPANVAVTDPGLKSASLVELTIVANTPHLVLSLSYMAHNGLLTRMLAEFEWARYGMVFQSLRVTHPKGQQRSTYRLQMPYRWSIPLLIISGLLHWVYSNCFYVSDYEHYDPEWPYEVMITSRGLQFSTVAILIGLILSAAIAVSPLIVALLRLPGNMVLGGSNSKVISAACHSVPVSPASAVPKPPPVNVQAMEASGGDELEIMATRKLKWGQISPGDARDGVGHLAFGVEEQEITEPVDGKVYSGYR